jgi:DNA replication ATP-dependent helicase Dna2
VRLDDKSKAQCLVLLTGDWITTEVLPGDIINVIGAFSPATSTQRSQIEINAQSNFLIHHPDVLVTATSIASSTPCLRKPLVTSLLPQSNVNATSQALVWGTMLHEIFQSCLAQGRWDDAFISLKTDEIVRAGLVDLVKLDVSVEVAKTEIAKRAKGLQGFSHRFIGTTPKPDAVLTDTRSRKGDETLLAICGLHDTEEDIWSPRFGLKGKLDASVQVILDEKDSSSKLSMPFEIKTGWKASMEHRAQTMLYTILMEERYGTHFFDPFYEY